MNDDHIPAPSGHAPRLEAFVDKGAVGLRIEEAKETEGNAWLYAEHPVEVTQ